MSWVGFHVYTFDGSDHPPVEGVDISNAIPAGRRRKTANTHANSQKGGNILKKHVLAALKITIVQRFSDNHIIKILTCEVVDMKSLTGGIDSIGVEGKHDGIPSVFEIVD